MHTTTLRDGNVAHHNGDFSGDIQFEFTVSQRDWVIKDYANGDFAITIPMQYLEELVGTKLINEVMDKIQATDPLDLVRAANKSP